MIDTCVLCIIQNLWCVVSVSLLPYQHCSINATQGQCIFDSECTFLSKMQTLQLNMENTITDGVFSLTIAFRRKRTYQKKKANKSRCDCLVYYGGRKLVRDYLANQELADKGVLIDEPLMRELTMMCLQMSLLCIMLTRVKLRLPTTKSFILTKIKTQKKKNYYYKGFHMNV